MAAQGLKSVLKAIAAALAMFAQYGTASAIDCEKAAAVAEKLICSDAQLRKADDRLNEVFAAAMKAAPDREAKDAILSSQRRWIKARELYFEEEQQKSDPAALRTRMTSAVSQRVAWFSLQPTSYQAGLIDRLQAHRAYLSKFSGGAYAGNAVQMPYGSEHR